MNGSNKTPAVAFTYNPEFNTTRSPTRRRNEISARLYKYLDEFHINQDRIVYLKSEGDKSKTYVGECKRLVDLFFEKYQIRPGCVILSDNGNAFLENKKPNLRKKGFDQHHLYPSCIHQLLSPNDNRLHGEAKQVWRKSPYYTMGDMISTLYLLKCIDNVNPYSIRKWFKENFLWDVEFPTCDNVESKLGAAVSNKLKSKNFYQDCHEFFRQTFIGQFEQTGGRGRIPAHRLTNELDGPRMRHILGKRRRNN